jgi:hypothetical protein
MGPADLHPNLHLGMRGTQHRAVMWRVWKEGGTGFLYWGVNCYEKANCPAAEVIILLLFACVESLNKGLWHFFQCHLVSDFLLALSDLVLTFLIVVEL